MTKSLSEALTDLSKHASLIDSITATLSWDQETYMPLKAGPYRGEQLSFLSKLSHTEWTSPSFKKTLSSLIDLETGEPLDPSLTDEQKGSLRAYRHDFLLRSKLPIEFVQELTVVASQSMHAWREAREKKDFSIFCPHLTKIVDLCRKKADYLSFEDHPYDALLNEYEPHMTASALKALFSELKSPLTSLLKEMTAKEPPRADFLEKGYPHDDQIKLGKRILSDMGFDPESSRLDETPHPMCCGLHPLDTRMTTRVYEHELLASLLTVAHEGGHGLYHANLPLEHYGTPLAQSASLGIDESQSRMWEVLLGRSLPYWQYYLPILQQQFPEQLKGVTPEDFYRAANLVRPTMIRVESDEVTYNLHVLLRFEIELALVEGSLAVKDLPDAWNAKINELLGITPKDDAEGCLQDIHWSLGFIGYFPTYTLGNLYASQFFETIREQHPDLDQQIASGNFQPVASWNRQNIHIHGRRFLPDELCKHATGKPLSAKPFIQRLETKFRSL